MSVKRHLIQVSRILIIVYIGLLSLFSLDAWGAIGPWYELLFGFVIHLVPALLLLTILVLTWRKPQLAGKLFFILAIVFTIFFNTYEDVIVFFIISGPLFIASILFLLSKHVKIKKKKKQSRTKKIVAKAPEKKKPTETKKIVKKTKKKTAKKKVVKKVKK